MEESRKLILRIRKRDLFSFVGEIILKPEIIADYNNKNKNKVNIESKIKSELLFDLNNNNDNKINEDDIFCVKVKIGYGKGLLLLNLLLLLLLL